MKAMQLAIDGLNVKADFALIDGNRDHGTKYAVSTPHRTVVGGDGVSMSIAAASILAKVSRDRFVTDVLDKQYPQYQFARHRRWTADYACSTSTAPAPVTEGLFSKSGSGETMSTTREAGDRGEAMAAEYLRENGYEILASQFRCRFGEIDLIARRGDILCFVEVKLRSDRRFGLPRDFVTTAKQRRIRTTAAFYMTRHDPDLCARFDVAEVYDDETPPRIEYIENAFE